MHFLTSLLAALGVSLLVALGPGATSALARSGCSAPPGTAATEQYCETLPSVEGPRDSTVSPVQPLGAVLPEQVTKKLQKLPDDEKVLADVILAMPASPATGGTRATRAAARRAAADPRLDALRPGSGADLLSVVHATADSGGYIEQGFAWTLVLSLLGIAGVSVWGSLRGWSVR
jgi:hypothetical protein